MAKAKQVSLDELTDNALQKQFCKKLLEFGGHGRRFGESFNLFLDVTMLALQNAVDVYYWQYGMGINRISRANVLREIAYKKRMAERGVDPKQGVEALAMLVQLLENKPHDALGEVFMTGELYDGQRSGQFFTPQPLCELMARQILSDADVANYTPFRRMLIDEPAVGGGGMMIAAVAYLRELGMANNQLLVRCADLDFRCVQMAYIQLTLLDIPAIVLHRNTLSLETWGCYPTLALIREPYYDVRRALSSPNFAYA